MIHGTVSSSELDAKRGLRAQDYLINPDEVAEEIVKQWLSNQVLACIINPRGKAIQELKERISEKIRLAYDRGLAQGSRDDG